MKFPSYKKEKPTEQYDAIVIGSGMSGITVASILARQGKKVLVLERHYTAGGFTHMFKRKGYEWDVGVHYIGEVHREGTVLNRMFNYLSDGNLHWEDMGEVYDKIIFGDTVYEFHAGVQNFKDQMKAYFPERKDQLAIDDYVDLIFEATGAIRNFFGERTLPGPLRFLAGGLMRRKGLKFSNMTTKEALLQITDNPKLIGVLCGQFGDYGLPPEQSSFIMHAMVVKHYFKGGSYPIGGSAEIVNTIAPSIQQAGGNIYTNAEVTEIVVENNKATGVKMKDGDVLSAPIIISSAGIDITYGDFLSPAVQQQYGINRHLTDVRPSASHVSLYLGAPHTAEELGLGKANLWIYPDNYDHDENLRRYQEDENAPLPVAYVSFPGAKDPDFTNRYPGKTTIEIIGFAPYERFSKWEDDRWKHRGDEYEAYKERIGDRLLEQLLRFEPQLADKIDFRELSSPLSTKHFVGYKHGEIYGIDHAPDRFTLKFLQPRTPIKGLYLTGQDIVTAGVGGALFSGVITASSILKKNVMSSILKNH